MLQKTKLLEVVAETKYAARSWLLKRKRMRSGDRPGLQNRRAASSMLPVCSTHTRFRQNIRT